MYLNLFNHEAKFVKNEELQVINMFISFYFSFILCYDQRLVANADRLMKFHRFWDAYTQLTTVINQEGGKNDNKLYRMRSQCAFSMSMTKEAIDDSKRILKNNPSSDDSNYAYMVQARCYIQDGEFKQAKQAASKTQDRQLQRNCDELINIEANANSRMQEGQIGEATRLLDILIRNAPKASRFIKDRSEIAWMSQDYNRYKELLESLEKSYPNDSKIAYRHGIISYCDGQMEQASNHLKKSMSMRKSPKNCTEALNAVDMINRHYPLAQKAIDSKDAETAQTEIEACISAGQKFCPANSVLLSTVNNMKIKLIRLKHTPEEALEVLNQMLNENSENVELMLERGDVQLELEDYDAALFDYQNAQRHRPNDRRASEGINKAKEIKKKKTYVDHYEILGLAKGASIVEIKAAYRKLVRLWHPDRYGDPAKKKEAELMMKKINQAYEILADPQKKQLYDNGQDPDDPMAGQQNDVFNIFDLFNMGGHQQTFTFGNGRAFHFEFHG